jgi:hypothetical protein
MTPPPATCGGGETGKRSRLLIGLPDRIAGSSPARRTFLKLTGAVGAKGITNPQRRGFDSHRLHSLQVFVVVFTRLGLSACWCWTDCIRPWVRQSHFSVRHGL